MAEVLLSYGEKIFILHGVEADLRNDGRACDDYRQIELETDVVTNAAGSARLRLATTEVLVAVKCEVDDIDPQKPDIGKINFFIDCSATATPEFEGRGGEELAGEISSLLSTAYAPESHDPALDMKKLCIIKGRQCWNLTVDVLLVGLGGNVFDVVSMAVKAALYNTKVPVVRVFTADGSEEAQIDVSDDPFAVWCPDVTRAPCLVTVTQIGKKHVVDTSQEEEACSLASLVFAVTCEGHVTAMRKRGRGSLASESIDDMSQTAVRVGKEINNTLLKALCREQAMGEEKTKVGFLTR